MMLQAVIVLAFGLSLAPFTRSDHYECLGLLIFNGYLLLQDLTMLMEMRCIAVFNVVAVFSLHLVAIIALIILNNIASFSALVDIGAFNVVVGDPTFWFGNVLIAIAALVPIEAGKAFMLNFVPSAERHCFWLDAKRCVRCCTCWSFAVAVS
jgi:hypothetical protein